jgi:hypothetical protein
VWVLAKEDTEEFQKLKGFIHDNSQRFNSPSFTPHITLAALPKTINITLVEAVFKDLVGHIAVEPIRLDAIRQGNTFYQSVFAHVHDLSTGRLKAVQYDLSLYYGTNPKAKQAVGEDALSMNVLSQSSKLHLNRLWLADCSGAVDDWKILLKVEVEVGVNSA